jgi:hypothetical protein
VPRCDVFERGRADTKQHAQQQGRAATYDWASHPSRLDPVHGLELAGVGELDVQVLN